VNVSAVLVTRGDVDMQPVIDSLPSAWEVVIWDNGEREITRSDGWAEVAVDVSVGGRYVAIEHASHDVIYVQDDDVIVSDPQAIVDKWEQVHGKALLWEPELNNHVVCNMPPEFRHEFYDDHSLVGFGAAFQRDCPGSAFARFNQHRLWTGPEIELFHRTCDIVFTALTPRVLVDVPVENLPHATGPDRMYRQPEHLQERQWMLEICREILDG
jgi:hypothetical protein